MSSDVLGRCLIVSMSSDVLGRCLVVSMSSDILGRCLVVSMSSDVGGRCLVSMSSDAFLETISQYGMNRSSTALWIGCYSYKE